MAHPIPQTKEETEQETLEVIARVCGEMQQGITAGEIGHPLDIQWQFLKTLFSRLETIRKSSR